MGEMSLESGCSYLLEPIAEASAAAGVGKMPVHSCDGAFPY